MTEQSRVCVYRVMELKEVTWNREDHATVAFFEAADHNVAREVPVVAKK